MDVLGRLSVTSRTLGQGGREPGECRTVDFMYSQLDISQDAEWVNFFSNGTCTLHLMGMYAFEVPRMYKDRQERGKQTMCIDLVYSDQGQLWQSGVQI